MTKRVSQHAVVVSAGEGWNWLLRGSVSLCNGRDVSDGMDGAWLTLFLLSTHRINVKKKSEGATYFM